MDQFLIDNAVWISVVMMVASLGFIGLIVRWSGGKLPSDGLARAVMGMCLLILVLGGFLLYNAWDPSGTDAAAGEARPVADFSFNLIEDDAIVDLSDYRGEVVLLNFWATWCAPCLDEMPDLNRLQDDYADQGLRVITLSDEVPEMIRYFEANQIDLRTVSGYVEGDDLPMPFNRMQEARPMTFVIGRDGVLRATLLGARSYEQFEQLVTPLLAEDLAAL